MLSTLIIFCSSAAFSQSEKTAVRRRGFFGGVRIHNKMALPKTSVNLNPGDMIISYNGTLVTSIDQQNILKSKLDGADFSNFLVWIHSTRSLQYFQLEAGPTSLSE